MITSCNWYELKLHLRARCVTSYSSIPAQLMIDKSSILVFIIDNVVNLNKLLSYTWCFIITYSETFCFDLVIYIPYIACKFIRRVIKSWYKRAVSVEIFVKTLGQKLRTSGVLKMINISIIWKSVFMRCFAGCVACSIF